MTMKASAAVLALWLAAAPACAAIPVVAAERVYGALAEQIAGPAAAVTSILSSPAQDPHLFEADPRAARAIADARLVIVNGAGYDPWMDRLLAASPAPGRITLHVADLAHAPTGANPHLWYAPATMHLMAQTVADVLSRLDPAHAPIFSANLRALQSRLGALDQTIATLRTRFAGQKVAATEPVFDPMAAALGLTMCDARFQLAAMNGSEPAAGDVAAIEADLRARRIRALIFNVQVSSPSAHRLLSVAAQAGVPSVGVSETQPPSLDYAAWMQAQLGRLRIALQGAGQ